MYHVYIQYPFLKKIQNYLKMISDIKRHFQLSPWLSLSCPVLLTLMSILSLE